jgi:hypothetical protein
MTTSCLLLSSSFLLLTQFADQMARSGQFPPAFEMTCPGDALWELAGYSVLVSSAVVGAAVGWRGNSNV